MKSPEAVVLLQALASPVRLELYRELLRHEPEGLVAGDLARLQGLTPANLSFHLRNLQEAGLVYAMAEGRFQRYRVSTEAINGLMTYLSEECCSAAQATCALEKRACC